MHSDSIVAIEREILGDSGTSGETERNLLALCDTIGPRFAGTEGYRRAADFMLGRFEACGLDKAYLEPFEFTAWRRGAPAQCRLVSPLSAWCEAYALPYSASTGADGVEAEVVDVGAGGESEVEQKAGCIGGRFVLTTAKGRHRQEVYAHCVRLGAVGFILGNPAPGGMLCTGSVADLAAEAIPAASVSNEFMHRVVRQSQRDAVRLHLVTDCAVEPATTWNVVGELTGTDAPDELVVVGGHLDSHDIGPGAYDNAAGAVVVMEAARLLAAQRRHLKRTVRFIGFAGEEVGILGSHYHAKAHAAELQQARFMLNCDMPSLARPRGLAFHEYPEGAAYLEKMGKQTETPVVCLNRSHSYSDHFPFILQGVPTAGIAGGQFGLSVNHFAHMAADTPEKISGTDLRDCAAFAARILLRAASDQQWPAARRCEDNIRLFRKS